MNILHGIDAIEVNRIKNSVEKKSFVNKVYTKNEIEYCENKKAHKFESYAARYAVKEAFLKAIGVGIGKEIKFTDIDVVRDNAKPKLLLYNMASTYLEKIGDYEIEISITHTKDLAIASVIIFYSSGGNYDKDNSYS